MYENNAEKKKSSMVLLLNRIFLCGGVGERTYQNLERIFQGEFKRLIVNATNTAEFIF